MYRVYFRILLQRGQMLKVKILKGGGGGQALLYYCKYNITMVVASTVDVTLRHSRARAHPG